MNPYTAAFLWLGTWHLGAAKACADWADLIEGGDE
ncbi:hypothetical protein HDG42_000115 [Paraburkholderia sp. JPY171]|nr:hypothetical protein [Paraburkholderia atlantica]